MHCLWRHALSDPVIAHELLGAAANLFAGCAAAKAAAVEDGDGGDGSRPASLGARLLRLAFRNTSPTTITRLALAPLASLAGEPTSRKWLLRSPFIVKVLEAFTAAVARKDAPRQLALLRAMTDVAGGGGEDGRRALMHAGGAELMQLLLEVLAAAGVSGDGGNIGGEEDDIDIITSTTFGALSTGGGGHSVFQPQLPAAALEALLLLRNLCYHPDAKAHVSANPRAIDALVAAAGAGDPGARAAAADALLALVHNGQRMAALLRSGRRADRLRHAAGRASRAAVVSFNSNSNFNPNSNSRAGSGSGAGAEAARDGGLGSFTGEHERLGLGLGLEHRYHAEAHANKCLAALVAVLGVGNNSNGGGIGDPSEAASPDSTLVDIDEADATGLGEECSDGNAIGPRWVR
jgi:rotatin